MQPLKANSCEEIDNLLDRIGFSEACELCKYYHSWTEHHPYGMGTAAEELAECQCNSDELCPRLETGEL